jgi:hypothetical protein
MPLLQITAQQFILFAGRPGPAGADPQVRIAAQNLALGRIGLKTAGQDADGNAGLAVDATGPVCDILAATKTDAAKGLVQFACMSAAEFGENLPFGLARDIGARGRVCDKEARKADWCAHGKPDLA